MNLCYFGHYYPDFVRYRVISKGLQANNVHLVPACHSTYIQRTFRTHPSKLQIIKDRLIIGVKLTVLYSRLSLKLIHRCLRYRVDAVITSHPYHYDIVVAGILCKLLRKPLIFDCFVSNYETSVIDRQFIRPQSLDGRTLYYTDCLSLRLATLVFSDTASHGSAIAQRFHVNPNKFKTVYVGEDETTLKPLPLKDPQALFQVLFVGTYVPLHGVETIIHAAKQLEHLPNIQITLIGEGQTYQSVKELSQSLNSVNLIFRPLIPLQEVVHAYNNADVGLGIFGTTEKAQWVVPIKVYSLMAMKKPIITMDSPAAREVLTHNTTALLTTAGDPDSLAQAIEELYHHPDKRRQLAEQAHQLYLQQFTSTSIGKKVVSHIQDLLNSH